MSITFFRVNPVKLYKLIEKVKNNDVFRKSNQFTKKKCKYALNYKYFIFIIGWIPNIYIGQYFTNNMSLSIFS